MPPTVHHFHDSVVLLLSTALAALAVGCGSAPPPALVAPPLEVGIRARGGSLLEPVAVARPEGGFDPSHAWQVRVRSYLIADGVLEQAAPAEAPRRAASLLAMGAADPIRGTLGALRDLKLARDAAAVERVAAVEAACADPARALLFGRGFGALAEGTAVELDLAGPDAAIASVLIARRGEVAELALRENGAREQQVLPTGDVAVMLSGLEPGGDPAWLQFEMEKQQTVGVVIDLALGRADDAAHAERVRAMEDSIAVESERLSGSVMPWTPEDADAVAQALAIEGLARAPEHLNALLVLRGEGGGLTADLAAVADATVVAAWAERVVESLGGEAVAPRDVASWRVESAAIVVLGARVDADIATPGERGMLLRRYGEAGRFATDLVRAARGARDEAEFGVWVTAENRRLLGSSDPAARVRALDWLARRGEAPEGFDPFASRDERRAVLRAADAAAEARLKQSETTNDEVTR